MNEGHLAKRVFDNELNTPLLDNTPCKRCGEIPETKRFRKKSSLGNMFIKVDRTSRIDCDSSTGSESPKLQTYHKKCWLEEVLDD